MRFIRKGAPPDVIAELRRTPDATWQGVHGTQKERMRDALRIEHRGLCAYCNRRLPPGDRATIEHWRPRSAPGTDPFAWPDLLLVCEGDAGAERTCDKKRGARPLTLHPARRPPDVEQVVRCRADGRLHVDDESHRAELTALLGLDAPIVVKARKAAIDAVLGVALHGRRLPRSLAVYQADEGDLPPFPTLVLPWLRRRVAKEEAIRASRGRA